MSVIPRATNETRRPKPGSLHAPRHRRDPLPRYAEIRDGALMEIDEPPALIARDTLLFWSVAACLAVAFWAFIGAPLLFRLFDLALGRI